MPGGEDRYAVVSAQGKGVGGVMMLPPGLTEPFWMGWCGETGWRDAQPRAIHQARVVR